MLKIQSKHIRAALMKTVSEIGYVDLSEPFLARQEKPEYLDGCDLDDVTETLTKHLNRELLPGIL